MSQISKEQTLIDGLKEHYAESLASLKEVSYNVTNERNFIEIDFESIHMDKVPALMADKSEVHNSFSTDTILLDNSNNTLYLIEFKEKWPKDDNLSIRLKCYDTLSKLCLFWVNILGYRKIEFFELRIKYCLVTRASKNNDFRNPSFLNALNQTKQCFKLKLLEKTFVDETRIFVNPVHVHELLSRITQKNKMIYHHLDKSTEVFQ